MVGTPNSLPGFLTGYHLEIRSDLDAIVDGFSEFAENLVVETAFHQLQSSAVALQPQPFHDENSLFLDASSGAGLDLQGQTYPDPTNEYADTNFEMTPLDRFVTSTQRSEDPNVCFRRTHAQNPEYQQGGESSRANMEPKEPSVTSTSASTIQSYSKESSETICSTAFTNYD
ncbi:hypothetical protein TWF481_010713 [Arthrobotrys musiformis]|uniref:Uncharacterized protein n=1 Tax=Arthrobotrys musiformis TaxID=47236 RepID=A0AAV9W2N0_9PEZI